MVHISSFQAVRHGVGFRLVLDCFAQVWAALITFLDLILRGLNDRAWQHCPPQLFLSFTFFKSFCKTLKFIYSKLANFSLLKPFSPTHGVLGFWGFGGKGGV